MRHPRLVYAENSEQETNVSVKMVTFGHFTTDGGIEHERDCRRIGYG